MLVESVTFYLLSPFVNGFYYCSFVFVNIVATLVLRSVWVYTQQVLQPPIQRKSYSSFSIYMYIKTIVARDFGLLGYKRMCSVLLVFPPIWVVGNSIFLSYEEGYETCIWYWTLVFNNYFLSAHWVLGGK